MTTYNWRPIDTVPPGLDRILGGFEGSISEPRVLHMANFGQHHGYDWADDEGANCRPTHWCEAPDNPGVCPTCHGKGGYATAPCTDCFGTGKDGSL